MSRFLTAALCFLSVTTASAVELMDKDQKAIPPITDLVAMTGDAKNGQVKFQTMCGICHQIAGVGLSFGPDLTEVGTRRDKAYIFQSILEPSAVVEPAFQAVVVKLDSDEQGMGFIDSENDKEVTLKAMGGVKTVFKKAEIVSRTKLPNSLMPAGMNAALSTQDIVDLATFLSEQKKK